MKLRGLFGVMIRQHAADVENARLLVLIERQSATICRLTERRDWWANRADELLDENARLSARLPDGPVLMEDANG
jgi:hypothetical protein